MGGFFDAVMVSLAAALINLLSFIPALIGAVIILVIGWILSGWIGKLVTMLLGKVGFDMAAQRTGISDFVARTGMRDPRPFGRLEEPSLATSFAGAGVAMLGLAAAALMRMPHWRRLVAAGLVGVLAAYSASRVAGLESVEVLGVATAGLELVALGLVMSARENGGPSIAAGR